MSPQAEVTGLNVTNYIGVHISGVRLQMFVVRYGYTYCIGGEKGGFRLSCSGAWTESELATLHILCDASEQLSKVRMQLLFSASCSILRPSCQKTWHWWAHFTHTGLRPSQLNESTAHNLHRPRLRFERSKGVAMCRLSINQPWLHMRQKELNCKSFTRSEVCRDALRNGNPTLPAAHGLKMAFDPQSGEF